MIPLRDASIILPLARRAFWAGAANSLIGPLLFLLVDLYYRNLFISFLVSEFIIFFWKAFVFRSYVFRGSRTRLGIFAALGVFLWGLVVSWIFQSLHLNQGTRRLLAILTGVSGSLFIVIMVGLISAHVQVSKRARF